MPRPTNCKRRTAPACRTPVSGCCRTFAVISRGHRCPTSQKGTRMRSPPLTGATAKKTIDVVTPLCDNCSTMKKTEQPGPITDLLRKTLAESGVPLLALQRETGVTRASVMRFVRGERSLRLDMADRLAAYFGLALGPDRK